MTNIRDCLKTLEQSKHRTREDVSNTGRFEFKGLISGEKTRKYLMISKRTRATLKDISRREVDCHRDPDPFFILINPDCYIKGCRI